MIVTNTKKRKKIKFVHSIIFILISLFLSFTKGIDYYQKLGINKNASKGDISKAYHKLAKKCHPDISPGKEKEFMDITTAYETLSDPEKRKLYDMYGENYEEGKNSQGGGNPFGFHFDQDIVNEIFKQFTDDGNFQYKFSSNQSNFNNFQEYEDIYKHELLKITSKNYKSVLNDITFSLFVKFYSPSCSHCVSFKKKYLSLSKVYDGYINFGVVNCQEQQNLCKKFNVKSFPHLILMKPNKTYVSYQGNREEEDIKKFINNNIPYYYVYISNKKHLDSFLTQSMDKPKVIFFVSYSDNISMLKALSKEFEKRMYMAVIYYTNYEIVNLFKKNVNSTSLLVIEDIDNLTGELTQLKKLDFNMLSLKLSHIVAQYRLQNNIYGHITNYQELTKKKYDAGQCQKTDSQICFFILKIMKNKYEDFDQEMTKISKNFVHDPIKIMYINVYNQPYILESFGLKNVCLNPNCLFLVAYRPKRQKFRILEGNITVENVKNFIENVISGGININQQMITNLKFISNVDHAEEL